MTTHQFTPAQQFAKFNDVYEQGEATGREASIFLGGAASGSSIVVTMLHGRFSAETEKAVQFQADDGRTCWFPKSALMVDLNSNSNRSFELAKWFKVTGYVAWFIERYGHISGISII